MGDDIVTRLRTAAIGMPQDEMNQAAADEIERLRAAGDAMAEAALRQQWSSLDVAVAAWKEARS